MKKEKVDKFSCKSDWPEWVGKEITKHSGKPFKSDAKIGIPISLEINEHSGKQAFRMQEDDTV